MHNMKLVPDTNFMLWGVKSRCRAEPCLSPTAWILQALQVEWTPSVTRGGAAFGISVGDIDRGWDDKPNTEMRAVTLAKH